MSTDQKDVQGWMEEVSKKRQPKKRLVFDKATKTLKLMDNLDPAADQSLEFTAKEATRFGD